MILIPRGQPRPSINTGLCPCLKVGIISPCCFLSDDQGKRQIFFFFCSVNQPAKGWLFYIDFSSSCWWIQRAVSWILQTPSVPCLRKAWKKTHLNHFSNQQAIPLKACASYELGLKLGKGWRHGLKGWGLGQQWLAHDPLGGQGLVHDPLRGSPGPQAQQAPRDWLDMIHHPPPAFYSNPEESQRNEARPSWRDINNFILLEESEGDLSSGFQSILEASRRNIFKHSALPLSHCPLVGWTRSSLLYVKGCDSPCPLISGVYWGLTLKLLFLWL